MPIYEYRCDNGHVLEVMQRITEDALTTCSTCGAPVQRVFHPIAVHFKGSGFYSTDYGKGGSSKASENGSSESKPSDSESSDSGGSDAKSSKSGSGDGAATKDSAKSSESGSKPSAAGSTSSD